MAKKKTQTAMVLTRLVWVFVKGRRISRPWAVFCKRVYAESAYKIDGEKILPATLTVKLPARSAKKARK